MRDVIDAAMVFVKALGLTEANAVIEQRLGHGVKYVFKINDTFVRAEIQPDCVAVDSDRISTIFEKNYDTAKDLYALLVFRSILEYINNEHA